MDKPETKYLKDYRPPEYRVDTVDLHFALDEGDTLVRSALSVRRNPETADADTPLILNGVGLNLISIKIDGSPLSEKDFQTDSELLTIHRVPDAFTLETEVTIRPKENTSLEGLYRAGEMFCTQCEAEGFRKITWFPDRPDVMSVYTCTIEADQAKFPVLLSNGNRIASESLEGGRHRVTWKDPFPKPCYLFALVAGDLTCVEDRHHTPSKRDISLQIYTEAENRDKCPYALEALKKAMKWDEEVFGLEYDLDTYMIVAVNDFNMGAMENKGLNIFNAKFALANPETATDTDFWNVDRVIAHEYFHNWTGNRVTLKNWFQLSLKEGLTVFRDQEFSADLTSRPVKRISDVRTLRSHQFPEDAGPLAHPVRPPSYIEMDNFYTVTVYEKGAEVIRMIRRIVGRRGFRKGMDLYFERHDGQAVAIEEFIGAMEDANGIRMAPFMLWYSQAGTPVVTVERAYDSENRIYTLTLRQQCPATPGQPDKKPMHIPVAAGLMGADGTPVPLRLKGEAASEDGVGDETRMLHLTRGEETYEFQDVPAYKNRPPVPSLLRGFSAPVKIRVQYTDDELAFLFAHDTDDFNRWDAGQQLFSRLMLRLVREYQPGNSPELKEAALNAFRQTMSDQKSDKSFLAQALTLPSESDLGILLSETAPIDPEAIHQVHRFVMKELAASLQTDFETVYRENRDSGPYTVDPPSAGRRSLKNLALAYLGKLESEAAIRLAFRQFEEAENMTDEMAALSVLSHIDCPERREALSRFHDKWASDVLVMDKWFGIQASAQVPGVLEQVRRLMEHTAFSIRNPNKVRALIGAFCSFNPWNFHHPSGSGYAFLADIVLELNALNPMISSRMAGVFNHWKKYEPGRQALMREQLERIRSAPDLSRHVYEIVSKALA